MTRMKRWLALLLAAMLALAGLTPAMAEGRPALQPGDETCGFKLAEVYYAAMIDSTIYTFDHPYSGAKLVYVQNDDPEVAFTISYRTPYVDESDANHVFEHAIITSSEKYPSKNLFYDLVNKAYVTYINAQTLPIATNYILSSMSEAQLFTMMDAYMSCMVAPTILEDERYFRREALRYELDDPEGDIRMTGTVFSEDAGFLTSHGMRMATNTLDALYPGQTASNMIGMANFNYRDLTYENTIATFERCYHFDNSLIFLYGDLDLERFLSFLDSEYLSKYPVYGTDLSAWEDGPTPPGFVDVRMPIPAYEGDAVARNTDITYDIALEGLTNVEYREYRLLCAILNQVGSPLYEAVMAHGIESSAYASLAYEYAKPFFEFGIEDTDPEQKDEFLAAVKEALTQVAREGVDPALLEMFMKSQARSAKLVRNASNVGVYIVDSFLMQWAHTGDPNVYRTYDQAMAALSADADQTIIKRMALDLLTPDRSALICHVPEPGLAERCEQEQADYLREMKASMTPEEIDALVEETAAFNAWNAEEQPNNDFVISPKELPDPVENHWEKGERDGVTVYRGDGALDGVGQFSVFFDLSGLSREELMYLSLSSFYRVHLDTREHTASELSLLLGEYLSNDNIVMLYPGAEAGEYHRPMLEISWSCLTEDFEKALDLLLEIWSEIDFSQTDQLAYFTAKYAEDLDLSQWDGRFIAYQFTDSQMGLSADSNRLYLDVSGQDRYRLISDATRRINEEEGFVETWAANLKNAVDKAFTRDNLIFMSVAPEAESDAIIDCAVKRLNALPEKTGADAVYELPALPRSVGVCIESALNNSCLAGEFTADPDFKGSYLPFVQALNDFYTVPTFRFKLGVYTAITDFDPMEGTISTRNLSDPNVRATVEALKAMPQALRDMTLTQEAFDGYILSAYSYATPPLGALNAIMNDMQAEMMGADIARRLRTTREIKAATLEEQAEAAEHIAAVIENSVFCMAGNEALIRADADCFDEVISYRREG